MEFEECHLSIYQNLEGQYFFLFYPKKTSRWACEYLVSPAGPSSSCCTIATHLPYDNNHTSRQASMFEYLITVEVAKPIPQIKDLSYCNKVLSEVLGWLNEGFPPTVDVTLIEKSQWIVEHD